MGQMRQPLKRQPVNLIFRPSHRGNSDFSRSNLPRQPNQQRHVIARLDRCFRADPHPPQGEVIHDTRTMNGFPKPTLLIAPGKLTGKWGRNTNPRVPTKRV